LLLLLLLLLLVKVGLLMLLSPGNPWVHAECVQLSWEKNQQHTQVFDVINTP
jgi:hypothetical protein